jgi:type IV secretion system protein VirB4
MSISNKTSRPVFGSALADFIPYRSMLHHDVVGTRDGDLIASWKIEGLDCSTRTKSEIDELHEDLCRLLQTIGRDRCGVWVHRIRRAVSACLSLDGRDIPPAALMLHRIHEKHLERRGLFVNEIYLSAVCRADIVSPRRAETSDLEARLSRFGELTRFMEATLTRFQPRRLGQVEKNGKRFSEQLRLYAFLLNGIDEAIPSPWKSIGPVLATSALTFHERHVSIQGATERRCALILDLKEYPPLTSPGMLDQILSGPYEMIETQSFLPMSRKDANSYLRRQRNQLISANDASATQIDQILVAQDGVASTDFVLGEYHYTAAVLAKSEDAAHIALADVRSRMNDAGFQSVAIDLIADLAWFAQLPGNAASRPRVARPSSRNFAALAPLHGRSTGKPDQNPWGQAVALLEGADRSPAYFNFHATSASADSAGDMAPGNTLILGPTGSGKTVLELFLLCEAMKFSPRLMLFDKDRSCEIALRAMGMRYRVMKVGSPTGINPLAWEASAPNQAFMQRWVLSLCSLEVRALPGTAAAIEHAVAVVCGFQPAGRNLTVLCQNIPVSEAALRRDLARWCQTGALGWAFDQSPDLLRPGGARPSAPEQIGIDLTAFYANKEILTPVILALLETLDDWVDGRPFIYVVTECWAALDDPLFASFIRDKQKTIRKQNGIGIFDTQSPHDLLNSPHAAALIEQSATMILLPNPSADAKDYCDGFKLTSGEFATLKAFRSNDRRFLIKQGSTCLVASLDFGESPEALTLLSSNASTVRLLQEVRTGPGDQFTDWWPRLMQRIADEKAPSSGASR